MTKALGANYAICRDSGSWGSPAHIPLIAAKDIKITVKPSAVVDASDRVGSPIYEKVIPVRHSIEAGFGAASNGGAGLAAIKTAFLAGSAIRLAAIDNRPAASTTGGGVGYRGDWLVKKLSIKYPLKDVQFMDVTLCPHGSYTNAVSTYTDATTVLGTPETQANKKLGVAASVNDSTNSPLPSIKDFSIDLEWDTVDASDRANASPGDFDLYIPSRLKVSANLNFIWQRSDTQLVAFETAWLANSVVALSLLDGPYAVAGSWGPGAAGGIDWSITDYPKEAPLIDGQMVNLKLQPAGNYTNAFAFLTTS